MQKHALLKETLRCTTLTHPPLHPHPPCVAIHRLFFSNYVEFPAGGGPEKRTKRTNCRFCEQMANKREQNAGLRASTSKNLQFARFVHLLFAQTFHLFALFALFAFSLLAGLCCPKASRLSVIRSATDCCDYVGHSSVQPSLSLFSIKS